MQPDILLEQRNEIYTVSRLNNEARVLLEGHFPLVWVEGEISNFAAPHSGHWYFSLKDAKAQIRCAMFRAKQRQMAIAPKDGMQVLIKAHASLYENRGEFQLIVEEIQECGEGKLRQAFELLKKKLEAAGWFDPSHKQILPVFPQQIGIITSATGAAVRDILTVLKRRYPCVPVIIYPTLVQGKTAAPDIVKAIDIANRRRECDVLILTRGGGSLEDLWPFNEEIVAQAIYQSKLPIISGVGHEVDFTIADFVADKRAPTPSAAAEIATPDKAELSDALTHRKQQIQRRIQQQLQHLKQQLTWQQKHLYQQHPKRRLTEKMQQLDMSENILIQCINRLLNQQQNKTKDLFNKLQQSTPVQRITAIHHQLHLWQQRFDNAMLQKINMKQAALANHAAKLDALSPLATLKRGFAIASRQDDHTVLKDANEVKQGDQIEVRLLNGRLECTVMQTKPT